jgi:ATP-dependent DNA helicase RecG
MPIEVISVSAEQAETILHYEEGHFGDIKAIEVRPARLTDSVAALANADGGELFVGIKEGTRKRRTWRGFRNQEAANGHLQLLEAHFPLGTDFAYSFLSCEAKTGLVLKIDVQKTRQVYKSSDGLIYVRRGAQDLQVKTREAIRQLEYAKGLSSFETELVNCPAEVIVNSVPTLEFVLERIPSTEPVTFLAREQLLRDGRPTVAGVLLFAEEPQALLPKHCGIKVYRYRTKEKSGLRESLAFDPVTIEGHLYRQIKLAVEKTTAVIEDAGRLGGAGVETVTYPKEALHEIITNAVLHRDYSIADDIHIRIFDNRVEIQSPGRLAAHVTPENILKERFSRNGAIVRLINKFPSPPNKDVGEGLKTAFTAMLKVGLKEPTISNLENAVLVQIKHEPLASPETTILEYLKAHETIRNSEAREICHIQGDYVVKEIFRKLVERQLIQRVPGTKTGGTCYRKGQFFPVGREPETIPPECDVPLGTQTAFPGFLEGDSK